MRTFTTLLIGMLLTCFGYSQTDINCIGISEITDFPEKILKLPDNNFLVLYQNLRTLDSALYLSKVTSNGEEIWSKGYSVSHSHYLSINVLETKLIIVGTQYISTTHLVPFLLILSLEGDQIDLLGFPEVEDYFWGNANASALVVDGNIVYFGIEDRLYRLNPNNSIEMMYDGSVDYLRNIKSFVKINKDKWLLYGRSTFANHIIVELNYDFESITTTNIGSNIDYFTNEKFYWDSLNRLHVIGRDHWDFDNPPIWKIATYSSTGGFLWKTEIAHDEMRCNFLGAIKEFNDGYYLFGISERGTSNPDFVATVYRFNMSGGLESYFYLEGVGSDYPYGSQDLYVEDNGERLFLAGYTSCDDTNEGIDTYILNLEMIPDEIVTDVQEVLSSSASLIKIYPTIFTNSIRISSPQKIEQIRVYNLNGQLCLLEETKDETEVDLSLLGGSQVYVVVVQCEDGTIRVKRVIKSNE